MQGIPTNHRVYLLITVGDDGMAQLSLSMAPPVIGEAVAAFLLRGMLPGGPVTLPLVSDPTKDSALTGPPGPSATDAQVASAVTAYLSANPPAAGKDGANASDAQVAAAVATYMTAHPVSSVLGSITFGETAAVAIQAGVRQLTVAAAGVKAGDAIMLAPTAALPTGYLLGTVAASADGQLQIDLTVPLIAIGGKYSITARVLRLG